MQFHRYGINKHTDKCCISLRAQTKEVVQHLWQKIMILSSSYLRSFKIIFISAARRVKKVTYYQTM